MTKLNHFISLDFSAAPIERVKLLIQNQNELLKQGKLQQVRKKKNSFLWRHNFADTSRLITKSSVTSFAGDSQSLWSVLVIYIKLLGS